MRRNRIRAPCPLQHKQLRQNRHTLQPDAESPEDLRHGVFVRKQDSKNCGAAKQVLDAEGVLVRVVGGFVLVEHEVDNVGLGADEDELEDGIVEGFGWVGPEEVCG